jgi:hypothetical protein
MILFVPLGDMFERRNLITVACACAAVAATVSGGRLNTASGSFATVAGGNGRNEMTSEHTQVGNTDFAP